MSYFVKRGQQVSGPYTVDQIKNWRSSGKLLGTDQISSSNQGPWKAIARATPVSTSPAIAQTEPTPSLADPSNANTAGSQFQWKCSQCDLELNLPEKAKGRVGVCPSCNHEAKIDPYISEATFQFACISCNLTFILPISVKGKHGRCPDCQAVNKLTEVPSNKPLTPEALPPLPQSLSPPSIGVSLDLPNDGLQSESPNWTQPPPPAFGSEEIKLAPLTPRHTAFSAVPNTFPNVGNIPTHPAETPTSTTSGTATLILIRKTRGGQLVKIKAFLDNKPLCKIAYGKTANVTIPSGRHTLLVKGGGAFKGASVTVNASPNSVHCYEISYSIVGTISLKPQSPPASVPTQNSAGITVQDVTALAEGVSALFSLFDDD